MKNVCMMRLLALAIPLISNYTVYAHPMSLPIRVLSGIGMYYAPGYVRSMIETKELSPDHEQATREYIQRICPDFTDAPVWTRRWVTPDTIKLAQLRELKSTEKTRGQFDPVTKKIAIQEYIKVPPLSDDPYGKNRMTIAHELAHYRCDKLLSFLLDAAKSMSFARARAKGEIRADFGAMKMLETGDPGALFRHLYDCYRDDYGFLRPPPYLNKKETLLLWFWHKQKQEEACYNSDELLEYFVQNREIIQEVIKKENFLGDYDLQDWTLSMILTEDKDFRIIQDQFEQYCKRNTAKIVSIIQSKIRAKES